MTTLGFLLILMCFSSHDSTRNEISNDIAFSFFSVLAMMISNALSMFDALKNILEYSLSLGFG